MRRMMGRDRILAAVLWLWVIGAMAAYLWQFRNLFGPVLEAVSGG